MDARRQRPGSRPAGRPLPRDPRSGPDPGPTSAYRIRVRGHLDDRWADWPEGLSVTRDESGDTVLTVPFMDQAALLGLLRRLRDMGARLVSVNPDSREGNR